MPQNYVVNLKNPKDTPEELAQKLNTLTYAIDAHVINGVVTKEDFEKFSKKTNKYIEGNKERFDFNDQRWHGGGLSKVTTDATLTGDGTLASPLAVAAGGSGTVTSVSAVVSTGLTVSVASATTTPRITILSSGTGFMKSTANTITYDNSTYLTTALATSTYLATAVASVTYLTNVSASASYVTPTSVNTLTNKRMTPRVFNVASAATLTPEISTYDVFEITAQAAALTIANQSTSTPAAGEKMIFRIKDNGTARAISYGTNYRSLGNTLPTSTVLSKTMYLGVVWNAADSKWDLIALAQEV